MSRNPTTVVTANGEAQTRDEATVYVKQLDLFVKVTLLEETPAVPITGMLTIAPAVRKPHLTKKSKRIDCNISSYVLFIVLGLSTSSSTTPAPSSSSSSLEDSVFDVNRCSKIQFEKEVEVRAKSMNPQKPKTKMKMKDTKKYIAIYCMLCRTGFRISERILVDERSPTEPRGNRAPEDQDTSSQLMNFQWGREQKWNRLLMSKVSTCTFRRVRIAISA